MKIYDVTNTESSLIHETWDLCDADITKYPLAKVIRRFNYSLEELVGDIINADGTWQYDDTNYTTLPRGKGTLVEGQESYSFASEYLQIEAIDILDTNGLYRRIKPLDHMELGDRTPQEYYGVDSSGNPNTGFPLTFDQVGDLIFLYPAPTATNVTLTNGIRVWFKRTADIFTISDTSQEPGLPSTHHAMLAFMAAIPYCMKYHKDRVPLYQKKVDEMRVTLLKHYGQREKAKRKILTMRPISHR